jgi:iron complex outermembrane receptor protein
MKSSSKAFLGVNILILLSTSLVAQEIKDSIYKRLILKEVYIQSQVQSKYPASSFYQSSGLANTEDMLSKIEGISLIRRGPIGMEPALRAFSGGQINMVIDGMKIFGACTDKMDPVTIYTEPVNLKSIDIKYAGDGMAMGSSVGGTLNLKLAEAELNSDKTLTGTVSTGYYSAATAILNTMTLEYSSEKWGVRTSGVYRKADNYRNGLGQIVAFSQYEKTNANISTKYKINGKSTIKADLLVDDGWNIGYPALPMDVGYARARIAALTYQIYTPEKLIQSLEAKAYLNSIKHAMDDTNRPLVPIHMDMPGESNTQGAFLEAKLKKLTNHQLNIKIDNYHNRVKADMTMYPENSAAMYMLTWPENHQTVTGIYVNDRFSINKNNWIDLKVRLDVAQSKVTGEMGINQFAILGYDVSKQSTRLLKNLNAGYTKYLNSQFTLYGNVGYTERLPTSSERYGFYLYNRMDNHDYLGNPNLRNEQAFNTELNLLYTENNFSFKLNAFSTYLQNYIIGKTQDGLSVMTIGADGVRGYENIKSATISGMESNLNYFSSNKRLIINNTLKWIYAHDNNKKPLPLIPPLKSITSLRFVRNSFFLQAENEFALAQTRINQEFGERKSKAYTIQNLRATYNFKIQQYKLQFSAGAENIFDISYFEHLDWGSIARPGRNIYGMLSVKF